jgi:hypothetical protein
MVMVRVWAMELASVRALRSASETVMETETGLPSGLLLASAWDWAMVLATVMALASVWNLVKESVWAWGEACLSVWGTASGMVWQWVWASPGLHRPRSRWCR